jgi:hypothetical protein
MIILVFGDMVIIYENNLNVSSLWAQHLVQIGTVDFWTQMDAGDIQPRETMAGCQLV